MTQKEKQILIKDLCARLPYGVKIQLRNTYNYHHENICKQGDFTIDEIKSIDKNGESIKIYHNNPLDWSWYIDDIEIDDIKPYLRSMSSMTDEEKKELSKKYVWNIWSGQIQIRYHSQGCWDDETECPTKEYIILFDWLNKHHFDYRGLIEKGLALEAPENMYKEG